ncbi:metallophosphoesterase [Ramlibacter sp.]|uniref:metallophosphoesterase family protein n=1 Tax=Ramlibacter sp. TaxID=1917967 RepID=UPI0035B16B7B
MRIAVLSDIHGNLPALQAVLEEVDRERADLVVNLGDSLSGPLQPAETADLLMARGGPVIAGNHERQLLRLRGRAERWNPTDSDGYAATQLNEAQWDWLDSIPPPGLRVADEVLLIHGTPASDLHYLLETATTSYQPGGDPGVRPATAIEVRERLGAVLDEAAPPTLILCGHTHMPRAVQCDGTLVVNPGSVGLQAYDWDWPHPHVMETGHPQARYVIVERRAAGWAVQWRAVPYDWAPQAALAQARGRPDWAYALATGRMPPAAATITG